LRHPARVEQAWPTRIASATPSPTEKPDGVMAIDVPPGAPELSPRLAPGPFETAA
jgi:hypothetical protein